MEYNNPIDADLSMLRALAPRYPEKPRFPGILVSRMAESGCLDVGGGKIRVAVQQVGLGGSFAQRPLAYSAAFSPATRPEMRAKAEAMPEVSRML